MRIKDTFFGTWPPVLDSHFCWKFKPRRFVKVWRFEVALDVEAEDLTTAAALVDGIAKDLRQNESVTAAGFLDMAVMSVHADEGEDVEE